MSSGSSQCPLNFDGVKVAFQKTLGRTTPVEFYKAFKFSPDGRQILASTESAALKSWDISEDLITKTKYYCPESDQSSSIVGKSDAASPSTSIQCGESIYDYQWYPFMNSNEIASCCFITTCRDHPIHLWDSVLGNIRCSYSCYNAVDELEAANCVSFNLTGDKIYAGSNRMIRSFDVACPGRSCVEKPTCKTRRDTEGQRGIISVLEFNPDYSGAYAAGSYAHSISIYAENARESVLELDMEFGVTCLKWSPCGCMLWAGGRSHSDIVCWDLRHTRSELGRVNRALNSNQKMTFAIDPWGKYLATGTQDGKILVYDTASFELAACLDEGLDCVNAVGFHPYSALLVSTSGARHFPYVGESSDSDNDTDTDREGQGDREGHGEMGVHIAHTLSPSQREDELAIGSSAAVRAVEKDEGDLIVDIDSGRQTDSTGDSHWDSNSSTNNNSRGNSSSSSSSSRISVSKKRQRGSGSAPPAPPLSALQIWNIPYTPIVLPTPEPTTEVEAEIVEEKENEGIEEIEGSVGLTVSDVTEGGGGGGSGREVIDTITITDMNTDTCPVAALDVEVLSSIVNHQEVK